MDKQLFYWVCWKSGDEQISNNRRRFLYWRRSRFTSTRRKTSDDCIISLRRDDHGLLSRYKVCHLLTPLLNFMFVFQQLALIDHIHAFIILIQCTSIQSVGTAIGYFPNMVQNWNIFAILSSIHSWRNGEKLDFSVGSQLDPAQKFVQNHFCWDIYVILWRCHML